jgi:RHS repeat-associated protein
VPIPVIRTSPVPAVVGGRIKRRMAARLTRLLVALGLLLGAALPSAAAAVVRPPTSQEVAASPVPDRGANPANARSYFGARYYRADIGRFTTVDPVYTWKENLTDPQRWNRYAYVRNNPLRYVDPDGRTTQNPQSSSSDDVRAKHQGELPVKATASGRTVTYEYANGDKFTITGTHPNRDQNPGNVITGDFATSRGAIGNDRAFAIFPSPAEGWTAMKDTVTGKYGKSTVNGMIESYAPPSENDTAGYQKTVARVSGVTGDSVISSLTPQQLGALLNAMARAVEGWTGVAYVPK